jgi:hypothetical protein
MNSPSDVQPYTCKICGEKYKYLVNLFVHLKKEHNWTPKEVKEEVYKRDDAVNI